MVIIYHDHDEYIFNYVLYLEFAWTGKPCSSVTLLGQNCCKRGIIPDDGRARTVKISEKLIIQINIKIVFPFI